MAIDAFVLPQDLITYLGADYISHMTCFHLNVRSAKSKAGGLELLFDQFGFSFDVVMLTETWYTEETDVLQLPTYHSFYINRKVKRGGGLAILTKSVFGEVIGDNSCITQDYEMICIRNNQNIFAVVYRPPNGNIKSFLKFFASFLFFVMEKKCNVICGRDFNIDMSAETVP
ncbi:uncharacterized protein LOC120846540, partial [Ixodes scapularis]|uniref:uncharacterized protein LOC120846540 n=1 Tax=Ixodes scapularis TaxID=6945 RepID=UPI001C38E180